MAAKSPRSRRSTTKRSRAKTSASRETRRSLEERLQIAEATLEAIRAGEVDALVVQGPDGDRVFTLQGADHRYRQLVETMNEGALMLGPDRTIVYANAQFARMLRVPLERVIGTLLSTYVAEPSRAMVSAILEPRGSGAANAEAELLASDGSRVPVYLSGTSTGAGEDLIIHVVATDLTEQKRSLEMVASERLTSLIVDQAAEGIVVCDPSGRVIRASKAAHRVAGQNPLLAPFDETFNLASDDDPVFARTVIARALAGQTTSGEDATLARSDGSRMNLLLSAGPILGAEGEPLGAVVSFVDVTEERRANDERAELLERTNDALVQARSANRAKDEFLAMLGHELRNPLAPMRTAIELMNANPDGAFRRERAVIERQVNHLVRLVSDLLDVSRIARGKVEIHRSGVPVADVITKAIEVASPLLEERQHRLSVASQDGLAVLGDEARLCQVVSNLLTNAAKYTARGGQIAVEASRVDDEVVIVVRDNGAGIAPPLLANLFDMFVQGERTIERSEGGLGLGLSIVKSLVELHGGHVRARSGGLGRGSEFEVRLPALDAARQDSTALIPDRAALDAAAPRRILIVDDNQDAAELLAEMLTLMGHETCVAYEGPSALGLAPDFAPDIAFLDIGLPVMDGYELAQRMRAMDATKDVRLVALTGYGQDSDRRRAAAAGFDHHLVKPINIAEIATAISRLT